MAHRQKPGKPNIGAQIENKFKKRRISIQIKDTYIGHITFHFLGMSVDCFSKGKWNVSMLKEKGYRTGSIVKVQLKNFLTYDNADVYPGPRLNVVLGPNGTGKSALTHAICLACGGDPKSVGRSPDLKQFVKRGCDLENAYAEVHLLKDNRVVSVRRTINSQNKTSKWHVNGTASTQKDVKELMNSMNIDVDNLCSFMAQDKVGNFSQANAKEILRMTLESIVNEEGKKLSDEQKELSCVEETKLQKQLERDNKQSTVNELNSELESMQSDVDRMHQRNELKDQKSRYEIKYMVVKAKELRLIAKESDEKRWLNRLTHCTQASRLRLR